MMQKINAISRATIILMGTKSASFISLVSVILSCMVLSLVITLHDFYSFLFQPIVHLLSCAWRVFLSNSATPIVISQKPCSAENANNDNNILERREVEIVMEKLGICCDPYGDKLEERVGSDEIATLFDEKEASLEEVRDAFGVFDENTDGYIDAKELEKVLCRLGLVEFSERGCQRMITAFDDNKDGQIDFNEFVKLVEHT